MKIAIIINNELPKGLISNTAAVLGISLGKEFPQIVRETVFDSENNEYSGITSLNIPILSTDDDKLIEIAGILKQDRDIYFIPFTKIAQKSRDYDSYKNDLFKLKPEDVSYSGLAMVGSNKKITRITGSLPLLR